MRRSIPSRATPPSVHDFAEVPPTSDTHSPAGNPSTLPGARALFLNTLVSTLLITGVWISVVFMEPLDQLRFGPLKAVAGLGQAVWAVAVRLVVLSGLRGTPVEGLARTACVAAFVSLSAYLAPWLPEVAGHEYLQARLLPSILLAVGFASTLVTWGLVVRCRGDLPSSLALGLPAARVLAGAVPMAASLSPGQSADKLLRAVGPLPSIAAWLLFDAVTLTVMWGLVRGRVAAGLPRVSVEPLFRRGPSIPADRDVLVGGVSVLAGVFVTGITYLGASEGGGRYVVTIGAILYGARRWLRGLRALLR